MSDLCIHTCATRRESPSDRTGRVRQGMRSQISSDDEQGGHITCGGVRIGCQALSFLRASLSGCKCQAGPGQDRDSRSGVRRPMGKENLDPLKPWEASCEPGFRRASESPITR